MEEIWIEVEANSRYEISNLGKIRAKEMILCGQNGRKRIIKSHIIKQHLDSDGYLTMTRYEEHKNIKSHIHRMLAIAFIPNPLNLPQVNHKNGIKTNNDLDNLEWCTVSYNVSHAFKNKLNNHIGEKHYMSKLNTKEVLEIRNNVDNKTEIELSKKYKVSSSTINKIINNKTRIYE